MVGFGAANLAAGLFGAFPITASDSRTAINASVGGRSQLAGIVAAAALLLTVLYLQPALCDPADPGARRHPDRRRAQPDRHPRAPRDLAHQPDGVRLRDDRALSRPISLGVLNGVLIAIGATFAYLLHKMMYPRDALLGRIPGRDGFYKLHRRPDAARSRASRSR